jgi:hypothetical protein
MVYTVKEDGWKAAMDKAKGKQEEVRGRWIRCPWPARPLGARIKSLTK